MQPGPQWKVINVTDGNGQDPTGRYVAGKNVTYQLKTGQTGTVFIPGSAPDPDAVKAAVAGEAANLDAISNLTSES